MKQTSFVAYDITGIRATVGGRETDCHTALRSRAPGQSEASTTTVVAQGFTYSGYSNQPAWMTGDRTDCLPASGHSDGSHQGVGVVFPIAADADRSKSAAITPSPDAEGRIRLRDPGLGVGENGEPMFTMQATKPHAVAYAIDGGNQAASEEVHHSLRTGRDSGDAVAFANRTRDGVKGPEVMKGGVAPALTNLGGGGRSDAVNVCVEQPVQVQWASGGGQTENATMQALRANAEYNYQFIRNVMAVRRLTPRECERLQGFPDDYTLVTYRNKPSADGPRYKALGNSMAVPVMRWIGERIAMVSQLKEEVTNGVV